MPGKSTLNFVLAFVTLICAPMLFCQSSEQNPSDQTANAGVDTQSGNKVPPPGFQERYPRYQLVTGDTMDLIFEFSPEFNQTVSVQPDGYISLRGIGDVHVSSLTLPQLTSTLEAAYSKILNKPSISVVMKDYEKPYFIANGQLGHPGKYILHGDMTVTEGIAEAGGFTEKSKHSNVILFRRVSSQWTEAKVLDVKKMLSDKNLSEDYVLHPGDMIFVPQNTISKISKFIPTSAVNTYIAPQTF
ncbi:polysaccharide biosynthesis/export family protein [Alloacidobacterium sp.]|uniref:polysaccharide biosynthesis/export family protein n=1 Tax=Alloacidobacterium sp. TaxID=2951999 RepID=UPI002D57F912|nr:polysaccharide biosynthesis/export family protein [Alloacidobacterium sp.]HYK36750.1 polysaccharide biosynthesis/export family protein [Alloacidobacterium sp.]